MNQRFANRQQAGLALADLLLALDLAPPVVVLALPRGGVPIGALVARALKAPLDLLLVRKIGAPGQPELAVAALVDGDPPELVDDPQIQTTLGIDAAYVHAQAAQALREIERRRRVYLKDRLPVPLEGASVVLVDDGIATGTTMHAAIKALRKRHPARLVLAVPVAPEDSLRHLRSEVDDVVCLVCPSPFHAVGLHCDDFHPVGDNEVLAALETSAEPPSALPARASP
jgi:putative phosphoribosyl transferase